MSSQPEPTPEQRQHMTSDYRAFMRNASIAGLVICPILILMPPRKLDLYTFSLAGAFFASASYQTQLRTGSGLLTQINARFASNSTAPREGTSLQSPGSALSGASGKGSLLEEKAREDWKQKRQATEGKSIEEMIKEQIWQVVNQTDDTPEELKEKDQRIVVERTIQARKG